LIKGDVLLSMDINNILEKASVFIKKAVEAENAGRLSEALDNYTRGLKHYEAVMRLKDNDHIKKAIAGHVTLYCESAEAIKQRLASNDAGKQDLPNPTNNGGGGGGTSLSLLHSDNQQQENDERRQMQDHLALTKMDGSECKVSWDDIVGLEHVKSLLQQTLILPIEIPQVFVGNCRPIKSILLYGPPGTGKTFLAKAMATNAGRNFYPVTSADLISKYVGDSEKQIKVLFETLKVNRPCILFMDELEALCCKREEVTHTKTVQQFLIQLDGITTGGSTDGIFFMGCTNVPWSLDIGMRRRLERRIYIPLPTEEERKEMIQFYLSKNANIITEAQFKDLASRTPYFSCSDIKTLAETACMKPTGMILNAEAFEVVNKTHLRPYDGPLPMKNVHLCPYAEVADKSKIMVPEVTYKHVLSALKEIKCTISEEELHQYEEWTQQFGSVLS
jgi:vacuolar protein-sorting-associated protein 4